MAGCLAEADVALDYGPEHHLLEMVPKFGHHLGMNLCAAVEHCHEETFDSQVGIDFSLHQAYGLQQLSKAFEGEELRLYGDDDRIGGSEAVDGDEPERRGTVDHDVVVAVLNGLQNFLEHGFTLGHVQHLNFCAHEVDMGRHQMQAGHLGLDEGILDADFAYHHLVEGALLAVVRREVKT